MLRRFSGLCVVVFLYTFIAVLRFCAGNVSLLRARLHFSADEIQYLESMRAVNMVGAVSMCIAIGFVSRRIMSDYILVHYVGISVFLGMCSVYMWEGV